MQDSSQKRSIGHGVDYEFRISKLGTHPKGGSPKDNCEFEKAQGRLEIVDLLIGSRLDVVDGSQKDKCRLKYVIQTFHKKRQSHC